MQPLDAGVIGAFKRHYHRMYVTELVRQLDKNPTKKPMVSQKNAIYFINLTWKRVTAEMVQNCWRHAGVYPVEGEIVVVDTTVAAQENMEIEDLIGRIPDLVDPMSAEEFITLGEHEPICAELTDEEITSIVVGNFIAAEEVEEEEND